MKYTFVLYLVFLCKDLSGAEGKSGGNGNQWLEKKAHYPFIFNGTDATLTDIPWFVSLRYGEICGGIILNKRTIISAAQCFIQPQFMVEARDVIGRYNSINLYGVSQSVEVERIIINPMYGTNPRSRFEGDIALLITKTDIQLNNKTVKAIRLPDEDFRPAIGTHVLTGGFGSEIHTALEPARTLQKVVLQIKDQDTCRDLYKHSGKRITAQMLCAYAPGKYTCQADEGGPLTINGTNLLVGVVSYGGACAPSGYFSVFTRVTKYLQFIKDNMVE